MRTKIWKGPLRGRETAAPDLCELVALFLARLLPAALARYSLFHALLFARLEVIGMTLNFLDNVLLLDFALKAPQGIFEGLSLLEPNFCHPGYTT